MFTAIIKKLNCIFYPLKCPFCKKNIISSNDECCPQCSPILARFNKKTELITYIGSDGKKKTVYYVAPYFYVDLVRDAMVNFKFNGYTDFSIPFSVSMAKSFHKFYKKDDYDFVSFIALSKTNLKKRGYNQAELLAKELSKRLNLPCKAILRRSGNSLPQHSLNKIERIENIFGAFSLIESIESVEGLSILIVDDIVTTTATLQSVSCLLLENGAKRVDCVCAAKSV